MKGAILEHPFFGAVEFDQQRRVYDASMELKAGHKVSVTIDSMGIAAEEAFERAQRIFQIVMRREEEYRRAIAGKLLGLYNNSWRDGEVISIEDFMRRISLQSFSIAPLELEKWDAPLSIMLTAIYSPAISSKCFSIPISDLTTRNLRDNRVKDREKVGPLSQRLHLRHCISNHLRNLPQ